MQSLFSWCSVKESLTDYLSPGRCSNLFSLLIEIVAHLAIPLFTIKYYNIQVCGSEYKNLHHLRSRSVPVAAANTLLIYCNCCALT